MFRWLDDNKIISSCFYKGEWHSSLVDETFDWMMQAPTGVSIERYMTIKQTLAGFQRTDIELLNNVISDNHIKQRPKEALFLLLLNLGTSIISADQARDHLLSVMHDRRYRVALEFYPVLLALLSDGYADLSAISSAHRHISRASPLDSMLRSLSGNTVAIVGNSPAELGKSNGKKIDNTDFVVRFNNLAKLHNHYKDYGKKTDLWIVSPSFRIHKNPSNCNRIGVSGLNPDMKPCRYWESFAQLDTEPHYFPSRVWYRLVKHLEAPPSAGLMMLTCALESLPKTTSINLYGFSAIADEPEVKNHYADNISKSDRHNWTAEKNLIRSYLGEMEIDDVA